RRCPAASSSHPQSRTVNGRCRSRSRRPHLAAYELPSPETCNRCAGSLRNSAAEQSLLRPLKPRGLNPPKPRNAFVKRGPPSEILKKLNRAKARWFCTAQVLGFDIDNRLGSSQS